MICYMPELEEELVMVSSFTVLQVGRESLNLESGKKDGDDGLTIACFTFQLVDTNSFYVSQVC